MVLVLTVPHELRGAQVSPSLYGVPHSDYFCRGQQVSIGAVSTSTLPCLPPPDCWYLRSLERRISRAVFWKNN